MRKTFLLIVAVIFVAASISISLPDTTFAQVQTPTPAPVYADAVTPKWYTSHLPNYGQGGLLALAGLLGALVTVFINIGGVIPGTAGKAKFDEGTARLEEMSKRLGELIEAKTIDSAAVQAVGTAVNELRDDLSAERRNQYALAALLYCALGSVIAALIANDWIQAVAVGAGWTGFLGSFGLKKDFEERKAIKDSALEDALAALKASPALRGQSARLMTLNQLREGNEPSGLEVFLAPHDTEDLEKRIRIAQEL